MTRRALLSILAAAVLIGLLAIVTAPPADAWRDECIKRVHAEVRHTTIEYDEALRKCFVDARKRNAR
jgi:hypothetical protein